MEEFDVKFIFAYYLRCLFKRYPSIGDKPKQPADICEVFLSEKEAFERQEEIINKYKTSQHNYTFHLIKSTAMTYDNGQTVSLLGLLDTFTTGKRVDLE